MSFQQLQSQTDLFLGKLMRTSFLIIRIHSGYFSSICGVLCFFIIIVLLITPFSFYTQKSAVSMLHTFHRYYTFSLYLLGCNLCILQQHILYQFFYAFFYTFIEYSFRSIIQYRSYHSIFHSFLYIPNLCINWLYNLSLICLPVFLRIFIQA